MPSLEETSPKSLGLIQIATLVVLLTILIWLGFRIFFPNTPTLFAGTQPSNLGVEQNRLIPCPSTPNCVSSQSENLDQYIKPLMNPDGQITVTKLKEVIESQPRTQIIAQTDDYLYAQFTSRWFGFVDDVEFYFNPEKPGRIDVRSASRLGESDLGVNRKRIETLRELL